ncbi:PucR family transcriptional regulator [Brevibacillus ginsengisoli]|uniref:PucR family transcriptional regulator n=1 Tax=Brevibacillus ginsengisoli TaxID=363854 RepID=UPI003CEFB1E2
MKMRTEISIRQEWLSALLNNRDLPYYARKVASRLGRVVLIVSATGRVLTLHDSMGSGIELEEFCPTLPEYQDANNWNLLNGDRLPIIRGQWFDSSSASVITEYLAVPLSSGSHLAGYLYVLGEPDLSDEDQQYLWESALTVMLALEEKGRFQQEEERYQTEFLRDILYNNFDSRRAILHKAKFWNWDLGGAWALVVAEGTGFVSAENQREVEIKPWIDHAVSIAWRSNGNKMRIPLTIVQNGQILILVPLFESDKRKNTLLMSKFLEKLMESARQSGVGELEVGVGTFADSIDGVYKVYQEAKMALELGKAFAYRFPCFFDEIGVLKFVFSQPAQELQEFAQRVLGKLSDYDRETEAGLQDTLMAYFKARLQIPECARELFIHENTLRNRLKKIEQLTNLDLHRVDHLCNLYIALEVLRLGGESM